MKIGDAMERRSLAAGYDSDIKIRLSHTCKVYRPLPYLLSDPICMDEALTVGNVIVKKKGFFVLKKLVIDLFGHCLCHDRQILACDWFDRKSGY